MAGTTAITSQNECIPSGWKPSRIRNEAILSPGYSGTPPKEDEICSIVPMESLGEDGSIEFNDYASYQDIPSGLTMFEAGDVLFAKITPCMENGKGAVVRSLPCRYAFGSTEFHVLRPRSNLDPRFLYYATFNPTYRAFAADNMVGAAGQKRVSSRFLKDTRLPLPPLLEQVLIADFLDASCAAIDAAVEAKKKQVEVLWDVVRSEIQRAVTRGIEKQPRLKHTDNDWLQWIPNSWELVCLKRIASIQGGLTLGKQYDGELVERPYLRVGNVQDGYFDLKDISTIEVPLIVAKKVELESGDVLMTEGGDLDKLGRGHVWHGEIPKCLHQNHIFSVRCFKHKLTPYYLAYVTTSKYGRDYFEATGKKTTNLACTNANKVGEFPIPLPSLKVQTKICLYLSAKLKEVNGLISTIQSQIATLTDYRKSLIHECVTGQRRVTARDVKKAREHG